MMFDSYFDIFIYMTDCSELQGALFSNIIQNALMVMFDLENSDAFRCTSFHPGVKHSFWKL